MASFHKANLWHIFHRGLDNWNNLFASFRCQAWFRVLARSMGIIPLVPFPQPSLVLVDWYCKGFAVGCLKNR